MQYNKLLFAIIGAVAVAVQTALSADGLMSTQDYVVVVAAALAAVGTWLVPNTPALDTAKTWVNALVLAAGVAAPLVQDGLTGTEWTTVVIALLTSAGVYAVPNRPRGGLTARRVG